MLLQKRCSENISKFQQLRDKVYFQKRIISKRGECAFKKNSATIVFIYCDINQFKTLKMPSPQARNQEFFQGRGVFFELGHCDKHSPTTRESKVAQGKNLLVFHPKTLKNFILNENFLPIDDHNQGIISRNQGTFSSFRKSAGDS